MKNYQPEKVKIHSNVVDRVIAALTVDHPKGMFKLENIIVTPEGAKATFKYDNKTAVVSLKSEEYEII
jgi:hypothetical protein